MDRITKLVCIGCLAIASVVQAEPSEAYKNVLLGNEMTIKYQGVIPLERVNKKNKVEITGRNGMDLDNAHFLANRQFSGVVVIKGEDRYEEIASDTVSLCRLIKNTRAYYFSKQKEKGKVTYYGNEGKGKVSSSNRNLNADFFSGPSYADPEFTRAMNALLPPEKIPEAMPIYTKAKNGTLTNGIVYEDFCYSNEDVKEAVRFYFLGNTLQKIAAVALFKNSNNQPDCTKVLYKIDEFKNRAELEYLALPSELKDVSK